jgi:hypothetical protein
LLFEEHGRKRHKWVVPVCSCSVIPDGNLLHDSVPERSPELVFEKLGMEEQLNRNITLTDPTPMPRLVHIPTQETKELTKGRDRAR